MTAINCPYCGAEIKEQEPSKKIWFCQHCSHSLLLEQSPVIKAIQSTSDDTALITLGSSFKWREQRYTTHGFLRFVHDEGERTEWLVKNEGGVDYFLSADDENFYLLQPQTRQSGDIPDWESLQPNTHIDYANKQWLVTEQRTLQLDSYNGAVEMNFAATNTRRYSYLVADNAETLVIIFADGDMQFQQGFWLDPFEIERSA